MSLPVFSCKLKQEATESQSGNENRKELFVGGSVVKLKKLSEKKWYNGAVVACIGVAFYVLLTNLGTVMGAVRTFVGYFSTIILGVVFAYILNPIAKIFYFMLFRRMKVGKTRWILSVVLALVFAVLAINFLLGILLPQLMQSIVMFSENFDGYALSLINWLKGSPLEGMFDLSQLDVLSQNAAASISKLLKENAPKIVSFVAGYGKNILSWFIALILAVYLLLGKKNVLAGVRRLLNVLISKETSLKLMDFALRCDSIMMNFLAQSLLDSLIVSAVCVVFMLIFRMQYVGLVSLAVGVTNLIPNFGPFIGGAIGAFVLLLVNPKHALIFLVFCVALQLVDGYILKPKLFSSSLGVSGLLILATGVVLGNMFGILGILLSIPAAAVLSFVYQDYFLPSQERRKKRNQTTEL